MSAPLRSGVEMVAMRTVAVGHRPVRACRVDEVDDICPWCIADGSPAARFEGQFTDVTNVGGAPQAVVDEILQRTPGFSGWQQERWRSTAPTERSTWAPPAWTKFRRSPACEAIRADGPCGFLLGAADRWRAHPASSIRVEVKAHRSLVGGIAAETCTQPSRVVPDN